MWPLDLVTGSVRSTALLDPPAHTLEAFSGHLPITCPISQSMSGARKKVMQAFRLAWVRGHLASVLRKPTMNTGAPLAGTPLAKVTIRNEQAGRRDPGLVCSIHLHGGGERGDTQDMAFSAWCASPVLSIWGPWLFGTSVSQLA